MKIAIGILSSLVTLGLLAGCSSGGAEKDAAVDPTKPLPIQGTPNPNKPTVGMGGVGGTATTNATKPVSQ